MKGNTIIISAAGLGIQEENNALEAINPGQLVEAAATGYNRNNANATDSLLLVAIENGLEGKTIDDAYAIGERVYARTVPSGGRFQGRLAAGATAVAFGSKLTTDGDGNFKIAAGTNIVKAIAKEAIDNSGGGTAVFIEVQAV